MVKNNKKLILTISLIIILLIITLGFAYAMIVYEANTKNQQLVLGEIYMYYNEINELKIENAIPGEDYSNYFEFTINGKNTNNKNDIYYEVVLTRGDIPDGKKESNRLKDSSLLFKLVEVVGENETILLEDKSYNDLTNQQLYTAVINKGTTTKVNKKYRLYVKISDDITICGGKITVGCDYYTLGEASMEASGEASGEISNWNNAFASIKVNVKGNFYKKTPENAVNLIKSKYEKDNTLVAVNTNGTLYDGTGQIREYRYSGPTANNYVFFDTNGDGNKAYNEIWRIVGVFKDQNGEEKVKLMRNTTLTANELPNQYTINGTSAAIKYDEKGRASWNKVQETLNFNDWTSTGLYYYLNTEQDESATPISGYLGYFSSKAKNLLSLTTYHLGNFNWGNDMETGLPQFDSAIITYESERGNIVCASDVEFMAHENNCNVWYGNKVSINSYVGLLYPSDYGYSSTSTYWSSHLMEFDTEKMYFAGSDYSWMQQTANRIAGDWEWFISPASAFTQMVPIWSDMGSQSFAPKGGYVEYNGGTDVGFMVRPVLSLISTAEIRDASGTETDPYIVVFD